MPLPLIPLAIGAVQAGMGVAQLLSAKNAKKRAHIPSTVDSRQKEYDSELMNQRANMSTGTAYRGFIDSLDKERANATEQLTKSTGGYYGAAVSGAQRLNDSYGDSLAKFGQNALNAETDLLQLHGANVNRMADRKYNIEQQKNLQNLSDYKTDRQSGFGNLFGALETVAGLDFGSGNKVSADDMSGLLERTAYDDVPDLDDLGVDTDSLDMAGFDEGASEGFTENFYNPKPFGDSFMKKKKFSLPY